MITKDEAIALAREVGAQGANNMAWYEMTPNELTVLCNTVRKQTLLEAAEKAENVAAETSSAEKKLWAEVVRDWLREMAEVE